MSAFELAKKLHKIEHAIDVKLLSSEESFITRSYSVEISKVVTNNFEIKVNDIEWDTIKYTLSIIDTYSIMNIDGEDVYELEERNVAIDSNVAYTKRYKYKSIEKEILKIGKLL